MSVTLLGYALLVVSFISVLVYMGSLGQLLVGKRQPGLIRTGCCRLFAALLYVGVALTTIATNTQGAIIGLGVFTAVQLMWQANSIADVVLVRRARAGAMTTEHPIHREPAGVAAPTANFIAPLGEVVVAAEIDRLSNEMISLKTEQVKDLEDRVDAMLGVRRYYWGLGAFGVIVGVLALVFGLVVFNRADDAQQLSQQNAKIIAQLQQTQMRLDTTVHEFCGLYDSFLGFYNPRSKTAFQDGPGAYDLLFKKLLTSSDHLQCNLRSPVGLGG
jgi:hypothetical protein